MYEENKSYAITKSVTIRTSKSKIWEALTKPEIINQYLLGAKVESDWKVGSKIIYQGIFNGVKFKDTGKIDVLDFENRFKYSYWSINHDTSNAPENYVSITYDINEKKNMVELIVYQTNYKSKEIVEGMNQIWDIILTNLKELLENKR